MIYESQKQSKHENWVARKCTELTPNMFISSELTQKPYVISM